MPLTEMLIRSVKQLTNLRQMTSKWAEQVVLFSVTLFVSIIGIVSYLFGKSLERSLNLRVVSIHEALLRVLLQQRGWLYDQTSLVTQLYFGVVKALSVRHPRTFDFRNVLPRLPVPDLNQTCALFLESVRPLLSYQDYARAQLAVREFLKPGGAGQLLQSKLVERAGHVDNWVEGLWHRNHYLRNRNPLPILSNWYGNDYPNPPTTWNVKRAANWVVAGLRFKWLLDHQAIAPLRLFHAVPIDMSYYSLIFGSSRIPGETEDTLFHESSPRHIAVVYHNQWFQVEVIDQHGQPYNLREIMASLQCVIDRGDSLLHDSPVELYPPIGVLTTSPRSTWATNRSYLSKRSPVNASSLHVIESALFVLCMDSHAVHDLAEQARTMFHGDGRNRWFDKSFQLITTANSVTCVNGEHSACDAPIIAYLSEFAVVHEQQTTEVELSQPRSSGLPPRAPARLDWVIDSTIQAAIDEASLRIDNAIQDVDLVVLRFKFFGKGFVKESRMSPDSFIQVALQIAYYRLHHHNPHTYETAQTRLFLGGRTETVRSCSSDTCAVTRAIDDPLVSVRTKYDLIASAVRHHSRAMRQSMSGNGCDRHLFALRVLAEHYCRDSLPELFSTAAFNLPWKLSTSQNAVRMGSGGGFGPSTSDGYGIAYLPHEQELFFHITSFISCPETSSSRLADAIQTALCDMHTICFGLDPASSNINTAIDSPDPTTRKITMSMSAQSLTSEPLDSHSDAPPAPTFPDVHEQIRKTYFPGANTRVPRASSSKQT